MSGAAASAANPMRVRVLCALNMSTLVEAFEKHDLELLRMTNGKPPTESELAAIMAATTADFEGARAEMRERAYRAEIGAFAAARLEALTATYNPGDGETMGEILPRMSEADRAEARGLLAMLPGGAL